MAQHPLYNYEDKRLSIWKRFFWTPNDRVQLETNVQIENKDRPEIARLSEISMSSNHPSLCWLQPESDCQFAVGNEEGLRLYSMSSNHRDKCLLPMFDLLNFKPLKHPVTALTGYPLYLDQTKMVAVGNTIGEVDLHFYPRQDQGRVTNSSNIGSSTSASNSGSVIGTASVYNSSGRACRDLAFNPGYHDILACGFDHRDGMTSLHIYDIGKTSQIREMMGTRSAPFSTCSGYVESVYDGPYVHSVKSTGRLHARQNSSSSSVSVAQDRDGEYGPSYSGSGVTSLSWIPGSYSDILVASKKTRCSIRWFDIRARNSGETFLYIANSGRDNSGMPSMGTVYDLQFDPFNPVRYMAHDRRGIVNMWDIRWATQPLHTFDIGKRHAVQVQYSPRNSGVIAALCGNEKKIELFTVNEHCASTEPCEMQSPPVKSFLEDARMKDRYDNDRSSQISSAPPRSISVWTQNSGSVVYPEHANAAFLWVPPSVSSKVSPQCKMVVCGMSGALHGARLPTERAIAFSSRGDIAVSDNWNRIASELPATDTEMMMYHMGTSELKVVMPENVSKGGYRSRESSGDSADKGADKESFSVLGAKKNQQQHGSDGGQTQNDPTSTARPQAASGSIGSSSILARRYQSAKNQGSKGDSRMRLPEAFSGLSFDLDPTSMNAGSGARITSPQIYENLLSGVVTFDPQSKDRNAGEAGAENVLSEDILVQMRALLSFGYGVDAERNARIFRNDLRKRDMWQWIRDAEIRQQDRSFYVAPHTDVSFYGIYHIMKLKKKEMAHYYDKSAPQARHTRQTIKRKSKLNRQRELALYFCGWGLSGRFREDYICALERSGNFSHAAGAAFIFGDHERCLKSLEKSNSQDQKLLSFMLRAQMTEKNKHAKAFSGTASAPVDMFTSPYLQMIFTYLVTGEWKNVISCMAKLPLSERLAVALRYLSDAKLMQYLCSVYRSAVRGGELDGLIVTGITSGGLHVLRQYVDNTADVQTASLVSLFDPESDPSAEEVTEKWIYSYKAFLNKQRMFSIRCMFDIALGNKRCEKGLPRMSEISQGILVRPADVRCNFCHQNLGYGVSKTRNNYSSSMGDGSGTAGSGGSGNATPGAGMIHGAGKGPGGIGGGIDGRMGHPMQPSTRIMVPGSNTVESRRKSLQNAQTRLLYTHCPKCGNSLPRCIICRMTLGAPITRPVSLESETSPPFGGEFSQWFSWCQTCGHGGHVSHMQDWFLTHTECPVPDCKCNCETKY